MLLLEIIKGARPGAKYLTDHLLSLIVFGAAAAEFLLLPKFGTSLFFLLTLFALVDFLTGVSLRKRRYTVAVGTAPAPAAESRAPGRAGSRRAAGRTHASAGSGRAEPAPSAASVAESVLLDHPEPSMAQPRRALAGHPAGNGAHPLAGRAATLMR